MLYVLTEAELADARNTLHEQLRDQTTIAAAKTLVVDAMRSAIDELPAEIRSALIVRIEHHTRQEWQKYPAGPVRRYFEEPGLGDPA